MQELFSAIIYFNTNALFYIVNRYLSIL